MKNQIISRLLFAIFSIGAIQGCSQLDTNSVSTKADQELVFDRPAAEAMFSKRCVACHVIADNEGNVLVGKPTRNGPNLFGLSSRTFGADPEYRRYGKSIKVAREADITWDVASLSAYLQNPKALLKQKLETDKISSRMAFVVKSQDDADLLAKYLMSFQDQSTN